MQKDKFINLILKTLMRKNKLPTKDQMYALILKYFKYWIEQARKILDRFEPR